MVLMVAGALDLHRLAVEEEALVGVETNGADSEGGGATVHDSGAGMHFGREPVEIGLLDGPERWTVDRDALLELAPPPCRNCGFLRPPTCHRHAVSIDNAGHEAATLVRIAVVFNFG